MTEGRRIGAESSLTRAALLDAAQQLMLEEGYAAVTSRRVATEAGLKPQLVHYYFRTMDDLFLAVFRRQAEAGLERQAEALESPQPLRALWEISIGSAGTSFAMEFAALARHRKVIRAEIGAYGDRFRAQQAAAVSEAMQRHGTDAEQLPPVVALVLLTSLSVVLTMEDELGTALGHAETRAFVEHWLTELEGPPPS